MRRRGFHHRQRGPSADPAAPASESPVAPRASSRWWPRDVPFALGLLASFYVTFSLGLAAWAMFAVVVTDLEAVVISTGSMEPAIQAGDVILFAPPAAADLEPGRLVVFEDPVRGDTVSHRIIAANPDGSFVTKGDANGQPDSTPLTLDRVMGVGRVVVPLVGLPVTWWQQQEWLPFGIWVILSAAALWALRWAINPRYEPWRPMPATESREAPSPRPVSSSRVRAAGARWSPGALSRRLLTNASRWSEALPPRRWITTTVAPADAPLTNAELRARDTLISLLRSQPAHGRGARPESPLAGSAPRAA